MNRALGKCGTLKCTIIHIMSVPVEDQKEQKEYLKK